MQNQLCYQRWFVSNRADTHYYYSRLFQLFKLMRQKEQSGFQQVIIFCCNIASTFISTKHNTKFDQLIYNFCHNPVFAANVSQKLSTVQLTAANNLL